MPRPARRDGQDRFRRYRNNKRHQGMRLLRMWVPDPRAPGFQAEATRQAELLRKAPEEGEALEFIERVADASERI
jgi:hypothetical protein